MSHDSPEINHWRTIILELLTVCSNVIQTFHFINVSLISELSLTPFQQMVQKVISPGTIAKTNLTPYSTYLIWIPLINKGMKSKSWRHSSGIHLFLQASIILLIGEKTSAGGRKNKNAPKNVPFSILNGPTFPWQVLDIFLELNQWDTPYRKTYIKMILSIIFNN